uniref:cytochrome c oxidase subunit II n=1 Tax=Apanteles gelechiidivoris TaxID=1911542 RepID=UPI00286AA77D|nr:cytochrome c oxidase subunit II [Apanteles gelechiidivoris]WKW91662.1 cytochrome c oxidase subunit 2 [Apanteles gelechiidivoris]WLN31480.1 cytochrome c oxidase subunit 2 [Apanteles gelechiidivoris]
MVTWFMMNFQDSFSYIMMLMIYFHDFILMVLLMILVFILYIMVWFFLNNLFNKNILHNQLIEIIWTIIPMIILIFMALPSLHILYMLEDILNPFMTIKILGHQWYWSYEYSDFYNLEFDSFMLKDYIEGNFRLLDVDNRLILPKNFNIRGLLSSVDVIHSWTIQSLGIKVDCIPGRMNQFMMLVNRSGLFFGQCSEICGLNHSFMPIVLEIVNLVNFVNWIKNNN